MNARFLFPPLACAIFAAALVAAEKTEKKQATEEEIRARLAEHAARKATERAELAATKKEVPPSQTEVPPPAATAPAPAAPAEPAKTSAEQEAPTVLPQVDVRKRKITELDQQLAKQNQEIARERKNTKPTALDETINSPKLSKIFAIFGGQSSDDRSAIARERVAMMEEERDLIEAIAQAETKEEKEALQKTLDSMRAMRRELEQSLR